MQLHRLIRAGIDRKGISQAAFAREVGVSPTLVSRWLNDEEPVIPSPVNCIRIADVLELDRRIILEMAGHYEEGPTAEPTDPQWELVQRQVREIFDQFDRAQWDELTKLIEAGLSFWRRPSENISRPPPENPPTEEVIRSTTRSRLGKTGSFPEPNDDLAPLIRRTG